MLANAWAPAGPRDWPPCRGTGLQHRSACRAGGWLLVQNGKETVPRAGNPFPAHPRFARYKQKSGRGEGL